MKNLFSLTSLMMAIALALPVAALSQNANAATTKSQSQAVKKNAPAKKKTSRKAVKSKAAKTVTPPAATPVQEAALSPQELEIAKQVQTGHIACELSDSVDLEPTPGNPGYFTLTHHNARYVMRPVESRTGAVRLEDRKSGEVWLQLGDKSMLMNERLGQRQVDNCETVAQHQVSEELKKNPPKPLFQGADGETRGK
ncbi:MAG: hypothetical protein LBV61_02795 [Burkholderiaceae bacterium]|jgi:hypothetical protein|nr:hypothetical protein [Burkholderiaceae bacterium]